MVSICASVRSCGDITQEEPVHVVDEARRLARLEGRTYALNAAPVSNDARLSGNRAPGVTTLEWLRGRNKCNQFVGEVLTRSGLAMPTWTMADGSLHFRHAEALPDASSHFVRRTRLADVRPGDLIVVDASATRGEDGAHVEIVSAIDSAGRMLMTVGARADGARERDSSGWLKGLAPVSGGGAFRGSGATYYFLRPVS